MGEYSFAHHLILTKGRNMYQNTSHICMPHASKGRYPPLTELSHVKWAPLGCLFNLGVGSTLSVKTEMGVLGPVETNDMFALSLCCQSSSLPSEYCLEFYLFYGASTDFSQSNLVYADDSGFTVTGTGISFCARIQITPELSICPESDLRIRFASGTSENNEEIALRALTFNCTKVDSQNCNSTAYRPAPIGNLDLISGSSLCQQTGNGSLCQNCG